MPSGLALKKEKSADVNIVKKMRDYSKEPTFKKKAAKAQAFLKKHGLPKSFKNKSK
jgi:hypothetical protein